MKRIFDVLLDLVYPKSLYCICCGNIIDASRSYSICDHCMDRIRWNVDEPKPMDGFSLLKCCEYGIYERSIIFSLKYNGNRYIADHVADICADRLRAAGIKGDAVIPVPLYRSKELKRGFNQSALIAEALAGKTGMSAELRMLVRTRDTMPIFGILILLLLIFPHETGHFIAAKACGVEVNEFALGQSVPGGAVIS